MYGSIRQEVTGGVIWHLRGLPWYQLPVPRRRHHCTTATLARLGVIHPGWYARCACGAVKTRLAGNVEFSPWHGINSRRKGTAHSLTVL